MDRKKVNRRVFLTIAEPVSKDLLQDLQVDVLEVDEHARVVQLELDHATLESLALG
jgi:hypothetical protein